MEYQRQIKELIDINDILKHNLSNAQTIIFSLEDQLYVDVDDDNANNDSGDNN